MNNTCPACKQHGCHECAQIERCHLHAILLTLWCRLHYGMWQVGGSALF